MTKKQIKLLVDASYTKNKLDEKKIMEIAKQLNRKDLKSFVHGLKLSEKKHQVSIALPVASVYNTTKQIFFDIFPDKEIRVSEDKLLMLGARVVADDMVYDFSLKNKLEDLLDQIEQTYDQ